jgi:hypothetical protein
LNHFTVPVGIVVSGRPSEQDRTLFREPRTSINARSLYPQSGLGA